MRTVALPEEDPVPRNTDRVPAPPAGLEPLADVS